ncbi:hypothetical protein F2Q69_00056741 [Brassica cretica]|uniref:Uncharacterized protein n=1 Tax=Brassica cretica TaxID=69181 RepID=A0A8S9MX68_BRACR|nr:hypothetical protein F2Q69_00056741 [Brassica cretica]
MIEVSAAAGNGAPSKSFDYDLVIIGAALHAVEKTPPPCQSRREAFVSSLGPRRHKFVISSASKFSRQNHIQ